METNALRLALAICTLAPAVEASQVRFVSKAGSDEYPYASWETAARTIQTAVDTGEEGDIVVVGPGEYLEQVTLKDEMVLWGSGPGGTVLNQPEGALAVIAGGARVQIRDLTIAGRPPQEIGFDWTKGIFLQGGAGQLVSDCEIRGFGFGILAEDLVAGDPCVIRGTTIASCASGMGLRGRRARCAIVDCSIRDGGARVENMEDALLMRTTLEGCGLRLYYTPDVQVAACEFRCPGQYEAIFSSFNTVTLASCLIAGPQCGVYMSEDTLLMVHNSTITQCHTPFERAEEGEVRVNSTIIWGNALQLRDPNIKSMVSEVVTSNIEGGGFEPPSPYAPLNIDLDPLFRGPENGDFRLRPQSPCIDYPTWDGALYDLDLDGNPRALYGGGGYYPVRDLGAYEYRINDLEPGPGPNQSTLTWSSLADRNYSIFYTDDLFNWDIAIANFPSSGNQTTSWTDDGSLTGISPLLAPKRFYRLLENP